MSDAEATMVLAERPEELSSGGADIVTVRTERRGDDEDAFVYVVVEMKVPKGRDAWRTDDVRAVRQALRQRAREAGIDERLVITFIAEPGAADEQSQPLDPEVPHRAR
jgi:hypothetical protein